ncbi:hypothetical protein PNA2_0560 [Pyrococcus sp. NA2]|nr:hypothetical protein PNA2_0560 [Pyrococcus sp. NA2]
MLKAGFGFRRGFGWWWLGPLAFIIMLARLTIMLLPFLALALLLYAILRR